MTTKAVSTLPPIRVSQSCSWCHEYNEFTGLPVWCHNCGHRGDLPRAFCNCDTCESGIVVDTNCIRQALDELAPGKKFIDLDRDLQSRVVQRAQELKQEAISSQPSALSQTEGGAA